MPSKPKRPCSASGCPQLTHERFCSQHAKAEDKRYRRFQRDPKINRRYGALWRRIRAAYIAAHPLCEDCLAQGKKTPVQEVHHVLPLEHGGSHDFNNLRSLCNRATRARARWMATGGGKARRCIPTSFRLRHRHR